jgi:hypothetical protein
MEKNYSRKKTINQLLDGTWFLATVPLHAFLFFLGSICLIFAYPIAFIVWIITGDKPIYKTQPCNFFIILMGLWDIEDSSGTKFMRRMFYFFQDLRPVSEYQYQGIYNFHICGYKRPVIDFKFPLMLRLLGIVLFATSALTAIILSLFCLIAFISIIVLLIYLLIRAIRN